MSDDIYKGFEYKGEVRRNIERQVGHNTRVINNISDIIKYGGEILEQSQTAAQEANNSASAAADSESECESIKEELKSYIIGVYKYKGSVQTVADLPDDLTTEEIGWVYNVEEKGVNYAWTGTEWDPLGSIIDLSEYATKQYVDNKTYPKYRHLIQINPGDKEWDGAQLTHIYFVFELINEDPNPIQTIEQLKTAFRNIKDVFAVSCSGRARWDGVEYTYNYLVISSTSTNFVIVGNYCNDTFHQVHVYDNDVFFNLFDTAYPVYDIVSPI